MGPNYCRKKQLFSQLDTLLCFVEYIIEEQLNFSPFIHSFSHTWRGAGNKKNFRHRTQGTKGEDHGWVSVAVYFSNSRLEVWIFFFCGERRVQVIWLTMGTATAGVFGPKAHSYNKIIIKITPILPSIGHQYGYRNQFACHPSLYLSSRKAPSNFSSFWGAFCSDMV